MNIGDLSMEWPSTEWLNERSANAAIAFLHKGADLLPAEPHIYASKIRNLVAEFETSAGRMTSIVSDNETILFAFVYRNPEEPIQHVIRRGSNHFRDELRTFTKEFALGCMATWQPQSSVGPNEKIGRRLFDAPTLKGVAGQPSFSGIRVDHFEETRGDEVSLDRLGANGIDGKVKSYLVPKAIAHGQTFRKPQQFDGWVVAAAKELAKVRKGLGLPVIASPVTEFGSNNNVYHAHIVRPGGHTSLTFAVYLRYVFEVSKCTIEKSGADQETLRARVLAFPIIRWVLARLGEIKK